MWGRLTPRTPRDTFTLKRPKCIRHSSRLHPRSLGALHISGVGGWEEMILSKDTANHVAFLSWSSEASWMPAPGRLADIFAVSAVYQASLPSPLPGLLEYSWDHDTSYMGCLLQR